jgi:hypothetical protein
LIHSMRLSLMKGAHADLSSTAWQEIGVQAWFGLSGIRPGFLSIANWERNDAAEIAMDARPGGPTAKLQPSPEGLGINPEENLSAVGAALNLAPHLLTAQ